MIKSYPYSIKGSYTVWPGPNSNSFVAWVLRKVPELGWDLPPTAVGKDYTMDIVSLLPTPSNSGWQVSFKGVFGAAFGLKEGVELHMLGFTFGIDFANPALKIPAFGRVDLYKS